MSLYHPNDARYFVNTGKTQHRFSTENKKGGSTTQWYGSSSFPRSVDPVVESLCRTTGVYSTNTAGGVITPLYIFDYSAQDKYNFKVDVRCCDDFPTVTGKYGLFRTTRFYSSVYIRKKLSMDISLWAEFNEKVILPCYPNTSKKVHRCEFTNMIISGPLILNNYAGPDHLSKEAKSMDFW